MARPLHAQLSLPALRSNLAQVRELAPDAQVLAVVKADAYGHGLMHVLPALEDADGLALVELDAAIALRVAGYSRRILLLEGFFTADELPEIAEHRLAVVVHNEAQLRMLERTRLEQPIEVFIKINTGMNRLGIASTNVVETVERLNNCPSVAVLRLMTHFARADEDYGIEEPLAIFNAACRGMPYPRSLANSAGVVRYGEIGGEIVRPGIMLYGASPFASDSAESIGVRPVMTLRSEIIAVQSLEQGETRRLRRRVHRDARVPDRRRGLRVRRWLPAPRAVRNAGAGARQEGANRRPGVDGHAHRRHHRPAGSEHRQPRDPVGRGTAGGRGRERRVHGRLRTALRRRAARAVHRQQHRARRLRNLG